MNKQQKIKELENKIKEMQKVYKSDVRESYREAQQTQEIIQNMNEQLERLKSDKSNLSSTQEFTLKMNDQKKTIKVRELPDPGNNTISNDSPIGKQLLKSKPGDQIQIGEKIWTVTSPT